MTIAYVLIATELGYEKEVRDQLIELVEVKEAYTIYGVYDIIVKLEAADIDKIKTTVSWKIRKMKSVNTTVTLFVD